VLGVAARDQEAFTAMERPDTTRKQRQTKLTLKRQKSLHRNGSDEIIEANMHPPASHKNPSIYIWIQVNYKRLELYIIISMTPMLFT
jgi:hypothetical protein